MALIINLAIANFYHLNCKIIKNKLKINFNAFLVSTFFFLNKYQYFLILKNYFLLVFEILKALVSLFQKSQMLIMSIINTISEIKC